MILCLTLLALQTPAAPAARVDWAAFNGRQSVEVPLSFLGGGSREAFWSATR